MAHSCQLAAMVRRSLSRYGYELTAVGYQLTVEGPASDRGARGLYLECALLREESRILKQSCVAPNARATRPDVRATRLHGVSSPVTPVRNSAHSRCKVASKYRQTPLPDLWKSPRTRCKGRLHH